MLHEEVIHSHSALSVIRLEVVYLSYAEKCLIQSRITMRDWILTARHRLSRQSLHVEISYRKCCLTLTCFFAFLINHIPMDVLTDQQLPH